MRDNAGITSQGTGLIELLDRVLDKGLVVAGDIQIKLADIELLTIRIRLIVCSLDKAEELGIDWWRRDQYLSNSKAHAAKKRVRPQVHPTRATRKVTRRGVHPSSTARVRSSQ